MKNFKISNLWQNKQKPHTVKKKPIRASQTDAQCVKDESWHMSPEDALRVTYSGHK